MRRAPWLLLVLGAACTVQAQPQRGGTFVEPPEQVDPVYVPLGPDQPSGGPDGEPDLQLRLTLEAPLRLADRNAGQGTQGTRAGSPSAQALLRWRPLSGRGWFAQAVLYRYLHPARQRPWDPDFTYALGYDDGQPGHWALVYANYTGTRFSPDAALGEHRFNATQGQWTASWRFALPPAWRPALLVGDGDSASCHADASWVPRFTRAQGGALGRDKTSLGLGCRYQRPDGWFAQATAFAWPQGGKQQPWDPDYTYGLGWTAAGEGGLTVQYANYSGNRWPGRGRAPGEGTLRSGTISVSWGTPW